MDRLLDPIACPECKQPSYVVSRVVSKITDDTTTTITTPEATIRIANEEFVVPLMCIRDNDHHRVHSSVAPSEEEEEEEGPETDSNNMCMTMDVMISFVIVALQCLVHNSMVGWIFITIGWFCICLVWIVLVDTTLSALMHRILYVVHAVCFITSIVVTVVYAHLHQLEEAELLAIHILCIFFHLLACAWWIWRWHVQQQARTKANMQQDKQTLVTTFTIQRGAYAQRIASLSLPLCLFVDNLC